MFGQSQLVNESSRALAHGRHRAPSQNFTDHGVDVRQVSCIVEGGESVSSYDFINLYLGTFHDFRI